MLNFTQNRREFLITSVAGTACAAGATGLVAGLAANSAMAASSGEGAALALQESSPAMVDLFLWGDAFAAAGSPSGAGAQVYLPLDVQSTVWVGQPGSFAERALYEVKATRTAAGQLRVQLQPQLLEARSCGAHVCTGADVTLAQGEVKQVPVKLMNGKSSTLLVAFDHLH